MNNKFIIVLFLLIAVINVVFSANLAPPAIPGEAVYIPFPVNIKVDGDLSDWKNIPTVKVTKGKTISHIKGENDAFYFSLAADNKYLYLKMTMNDKNIIAGKHGSNYYMEDSLEFFINASGNLIARSYTKRVIQINISPVDIGNTNPEKLTISGVHSDLGNVKGFVFKTDNGWGFEAAFEIEGILVPEHGYEFGFQAQANGATQQDRNVKLIWSNLDTVDASWRDPSVFGRGIFFQIGRKDIPLPKKIEIKKEEKIIPAIALNQIGYLPDSSKKITILSDNPGTLDFTLLDKDGNVVFEGETENFGHDPASGNKVHIIDISKWKMPGQDYYIEAGGHTSYKFDIDNNIYSQLREDALGYYYQMRSGIPIESKYVDKKYTRPAGHLSDSKVACFTGYTESGGYIKGEDYTLDVSGGWYDAGDFGKYVVNAGITVWTLLNQYELNPNSYKDGDLSIPEQNNSIPDLLDEVRWELEWMIKMQVPAGYKLAGMVHHKMHNRKYEPLRLVPPTNMDNDLEFKSDFKGRYLYPPTTAATLNYAAVLAQASRVWKKIDPQFADKCLKHAEIAWKAVKDKLPIPAGNIPGAGGGDYGDMKLEDEYYWAACELYITTGKSEYKKFLMSNEHFMQLPQSVGSSMTWGDTASLGTISLAFIPNNLSNKNIKEARNNIIKIAESYLDRIAKEGYKVPINDYRWGSNSFVLNNMIIMALAYKLTGDKKFIYGTMDGMDYILGRNPLSKSYVSGYGEDPVKNVHHRFWANYPDENYPMVPPGIICGGPNRLPDRDDYAASDASLSGKPQAKCYVDEFGSYSTNEVAINWNAPLAWVTAFIDDYAKGKIEISDKIIKPKKSFASIILFILIISLAVILLAIIILFIIFKMKKKP